MDYKVIAKVNQFGWILHIDPINDLIKELIPWFSLSFAASDSNSLYSILFMKSMSEKQCTSIKTMQTIKTYRSQSS